MAPAGGDPIADVPTVELQAGTNLIVYAVGGLDDGSFTFYTQTIEGLGGAPGGVPTGNSDLSSGNSNTTTIVLIALAAVMALAGSGMVVAASRRARS